MNLDGCMVSRIFSAENLKLYKSELDGPSGSGFHDVSGLIMVNSPRCTSVSPTPDVFKILVSTISISSSAPTITCNRNESPTPAVSSIT